MAFSMWTIVRIFVYNCDATIQGRRRREKINIRPDFNRKTICKFLVKYCTVKQIINFYNSKLQQLLYKSMLHAACTLEVQNLEQKMSTF